MLTFHQGEYTVCIHVAKCDCERLDFSLGQLHLQFLLDVILVSVFNWSLRVHTIKIRNSRMCQELLENYDGRNSKS